MELLITYISMSFELQFFIILFLGLLVGSFLNVVNYRLPLMEDYSNALMIKENAKVAGKPIDDIITKNKGINLAFPPSACPKCGHQIRCYENIPVLSYLFLRGKCSSCKVKIPYEYVVTESIHCILWMIAFCHYGFSIELCFILPLISILYSLAIIDMKHRIIFDSYHLIILSLGLLFTAYGFNSIDIKDSINASIISFLSVYSFIVCYEKIRGFEDDILGRGDIKLIGAMSSWLGLGLLSKFMFVSSIIGILFFILLSIFGKIGKCKKSYQLPFGPSIVLAFIFTFFNFI